MNTHKHDGFTIIELLIVSAISGILIAIAVPNLRPAMDNANDTAVKGYIFHVVNGIEAARDRETYVLPPLQSCAALTNISVDPASVTSCSYDADPDHDLYTVTAVSVTGTTFRYDGTEISVIE